MSGSEQQSEQMLVAITPNLVAKLNRYLTHGGTRDEADMLNEHLVTQVQMRPAFPASLLTPKSLPLAPQEVVMEQPTEVKESGNESGSVS